MRGVFVAIEGIDRSGKSSLAKSLTTSLGELGHAATLIGYPNRKNATGAVINEILQKRTELKSEATHLLFSANRWEDSERVARLLGGVGDKGECSGDSGRRDSAHSAATSTANIVICDRYILSGVSYSLANGLSRGFCVSSDRGLPVPGLTLFLDVGPEEARLRKGFGVEAYESLEFQTRVYSKMKEELSSYPHAVLESAPPAILHERALARILQHIRECERGAILSGFVGTSPRVYEPA